MLGAALAQAAQPGVESVEVITRRFADERLGATYAQASERIGHGVTLTRIRGGGQAYLEKEALERALPELAADYLRRLERGPRPHVLHAHFADAAELAFAARERFGIPVVYTPHSLALGKRACGLGSAALERRIRRERRAISEADAVIVSSRDEAERQLEMYGVEAAGRTHRIGPGVWMAPSPPGTHAARELLAPFLRVPDRPLVLAIARPVAKKNLVALVEAFAEVPGLRDRANLAVVAGLRDGPGSGDAEQQAVIRGLLDGVDRYGLYGSVALPRRHRPGDVAQLYRLAAQTGGVFVNPALHEPFGLTLLEAAVHGLPVVATDSGGPRDILGEVGHGLLVDPHDRRALGTAIARVVDDATARAAYVSAAASVGEVFGWERYAGAAARVYGDLVSGGVGPQSHPRSPAVRSLLVSDMDGTLTGSRVGSRRFKEVLRELPELCFVLATGRSLPEARRVLAAWQLPLPEVFVTAVGTEVHYVDRAGRARLDAEYARRAERAWDREAVRAHLGRVGLHEQAAIEQRRWKLGYLGDEVEAHGVREGLAEAGLPATVTHSHGRFIDVTPAGFDKARAMAWVAQRYGLGAEACIACGDSGNDATMLAAAGTAVVVANALPELDAALARLTCAGRVVRTRLPHAGGVADAVAALNQLHAPASVFAGGTSANS